MSLLRRSKRDVRVQTDVGLDRLSLSVQCHGHALDQGAEDESVLATDSRYFYHGACGDGPNDSRSIDVDAVNDDKDRACVKDVRERDILLPVRLGDGLASLSAVSRSRLCRSQLQSCDTFAETADRMIGKKEPARLCKMSDLQRLKCDGGELLT